MVANITLAQMLHNVDKTFLKHLKKMSELDLHEGTTNPE